MTSFQRWEQRSAELTADLGSLARSLTKGASVDLELAGRLEDLARRIRRHVTDAYILAERRGEQKP